MTTGERLLGPGPDSPLREVGVHVEAAAQLGPRKTSLTGEARGLTNDLVRRRLLFGMFTGQSLVWRVI